MPKPPALSDAVPRTTPIESGRAPDPRVLDVVRRFWGFDRLRPLQADAIDAGLSQRDSLVVMPTGGGKSLCYQVPPVLAERTDVVVSPLISLMKDQVDGLRACGYPAAALHSGLIPEERRAAERDILAGKIRLIFVSPEKLLTPPFIAMLRDVRVRAFAIDEAHCISHWGHDFRPEYRQLRTIKEHFADASLHAYTATATQRVRNDIVKQLGLREPSVLVGIFDRPNLIYRVLQRKDGAHQTAQVLKRHAGEAAIVYCISRADTENMAETLRSMKIDARHYHAGMSPDQRRRVQDDFADEKLNVVVATVAFGMGIDRSNVRCVVHAAMPKSIEHYQQETGRAGRDGLEAECVLLYSGGDVVKWDSLIVRSAENAEKPQQVIDAMSELLGQMQRFAGGYDCRHKVLSEYFDQTYPKANCGACDVCLAEHEHAQDGLVIAQKLLSCVARLDQRFGVKQVVDVAKGADTEKVRQYRHDRIKTYGALAEVDAKTLRSYVNQLVDQGILERSKDEFPVLKLNEASWQVMRGQRAVQLIDPGLSTTKTTEVSTVSWKGVDVGLFESLRAVRREIAERRRIPPYQVFNDATLREMAAVRPGSLESLICIRGVGQRKAADFGPTFVNAITTYCNDHSLSLDIGMGSRPRRFIGATVDADMINEVAHDDNDSAAPATPRRISKSKQAAFDMYGAGVSIDDVMTSLGRARSTAVSYLCDYIVIQRPSSVLPWVNEKNYAKIAHAIDDVGLGPLRPIFEFFGGQMDYEVIQIVSAHKKALQKRSSEPSMAAAVSPDDDMPF